MPRTPDEALTIFWDNQHQAAGSCISLDNMHRAAIRLLQTYPSNPAETV